MGFIFGIVKRLIRLAVYFFIFAAIIVLIPNVPPYTKFSSILHEPTLPSTGPLAPNELLNNPDKAYVDKLLGPEAFQVYKGDLYTSLATGEIVKASPGGHVTFVTKIGHPCSGLTHEHICGRPLGFQIDEAKNVMYVSDAYHGIWKVDLKNDKKQLLVSPRVAIGDREPKLFNALALSKNGDLYWTDSSSDFQLKDGALTTLVDPSGRLFHYSAAKNQSKVLLDNLWFPNGLALSPDNQFVVVAETSRYRLMKYYIDGPKKGKSEVFIAGLPGVPDNVRPLPDGSGILVGLYTVFGADDPLVARTMAATPLVRKFLARIQRIAELPFEYLHTLYPNILFEEIVYNIGHFKSVSGLLPKKTGLLQVDWNGNIVASYFNTDGSLTHISDAIVYNNRLYTGSPHGQNFIGSLPVPPLLKKAFETKPVPTQAKTVETPRQTKPVETPKQTKPVETPKQAKPVETPKQAKPVETPKEAKPVETPKQAKPVETPKQAKPVETPKQAKPVETPKQAKPVETPKQAKPVETPKQAKPVETPKQIKPVETPKQAKPVETPKKVKPVEKPKAKVEEKPKVEVHKNVPKPADQVKPQQQVKPAEQKLAEPKPDQQKTTPPPAETKPEIKNTPPPTPKPTSKATPQPSKPDSKATDTKPATVKAKSTDAKPNKVTKPKGEEAPINKPEQIPIMEEIPSDTAKPTKDTLKVIKKGGPAEIPNPGL